MISTNTGGAHTWLALEQVLTFKSCDMTDSSEDVGAVSGSSFDAVAVINSPLSSFMINVKMTQ
jgi:hypothetical protein